jgi:hypothetical protein
MRNEKTSCGFFAGRFFVLGMNLLIYPFSFCAQGMRVLYINSCVRSVSSNGQRHLQEGTPTISFQPRSYREFKIEGYDMI